MKKLILGLLSFLLMAGTVVAQDGKKALKDANSAYRTYNLSPTDNADKLQEAIAAIDEATQAADTRESIDTWLTKGDIYKSVCTNFATMSALNPDYEKDVENAAILAFESYMKALDYVEKKRHTRTIQSGIEAVQNFLVGEGAAFYEKGDYENAYMAFQYSLDAHDFLTENGGKTIFEDEAALQDQMYYTGLAALNAQKVADAKPLFNALKEGGYDKPAIYEALYKLEVETDRDAALAILEDGRAKFPDDVSLLFNEINHYLQDGRMNELVGKLETAIEKEPDNVSLYTTLGSIYDNLYQKSLEDGDEEAAQVNFDKAYKTYQEALDKQPDFFDAVYSIGALYYNRAAATTKDMNALADDYSKEGLKKYDELRKKVLTQFDEALPWFKKAEAMNPNDRNTLIALKEIFARKDDLPTSNEFKSRLETLEAGGTNESSYFNE